MNTYKLSSLLNPILVFRGLKEQILDDNNYWRIWCSLCFVVTASRISSVLSLCSELMWSQLSSHCRASFILPHLSSLRDDLYHLIVFLFNRLQRLSLLFYHISLNLLKASGLFFNMLPILPDMYDFSSRMVHSFSFCFFIL